MMLTIAIPTVKGREKEFKALVLDLEKQSKEIEIIHLLDNKEISIGKKRDLLYKMATGEYTVMIDDDDSIAPYFVEKILEVLNEKPDCVGYLENCVINGQSKMSSISLKNKEWETFKTPKNGIWYLRTPFFKVPIKTEICCDVGVKDMRYGEDYEFSQRVYPHLKTEIYINERMYYYRFDTWRDENDRKLRYGIKDHT